MGNPGHQYAASPIVSMRVSTGPADETVALAVTLLRQIAEDALLRASYRAAARRHLRRLFPPEGRLVAAVETEDEH